MSETDGTLCVQVIAGGLVVVMMVVTGLRGTGAEAVVALTAEAMIEVALTAGVMIEVALNEVEEEEARPLVWGKSENLPTYRYYYLLLVLLDGSAQIIIHLLDESIPHFISHMSLSCSKYYMAVAMKFFFSLLFVQHKRGQEKVSVGYYTALRFSQQCW